MQSTVLRFTFDSRIDLSDAEATLHLAILAAEGLYGEARVRMDLAYFTDRAHRVIHLDTGSPSGDAVARIFTIFAAREFGDRAFAVRRVRVAQPLTPAPAGAAA
ncbi:MAG: hypothetical protein Kow0067_19310 [Coriobacteriia bacterium]